MSGGSTEHLVYGHTIDKLFNDVLRDKLTPELREALRQKGIDLSQPILPAYPLLVFADCLELTARHIYPHIPVEAGLRALGEAQVEAFLRTLIGRATFSLLKMLGPRRAFERITSIWRNGNNFVQARVREVSRDTLEVWVNEVGRQPDSILGILQGALWHLTGKASRVKVTSYDGHACTYLIELSG
jgi:uncharacterized protein (TIGR02265 family)